MYTSHLYCLAVQAGFYGDGVECLISTRVVRVQSPAGSGLKNNYYSPVTFGAERGANITGEEKLFRTDPAGDCTPTTRVEIRPRRHKSRLAPQGSSTMLLN